MAGGFSRQKRLLPCYVLLTTTHQTVDTDDDLSRAMEAGDQLAVSFSLLIHPEPLRMVTSLSVLPGKSPQGQLKVLTMGDLGVS